MKYRLAQSHRREEDAQGMSLSGEPCDVLSVGKDELMRLVTTLFHDTKFPSMLLELDLPRKCCSLSASCAGGVAVPRRWT